MKRKTCLLIAFVLLFGCFSMPSVLADKEPDKNIELLNLLNITDLMPTDGENYITRGELAYVAASLGSGGAVDSETVILETGFSDVDASYEYSSYIAAAVNMGYMFGNGDGTFEPLGSVSRRGLTAVMLRVLGYGAPVVAEEQYSRLANSFKLYKDVYLNSDSKLTVSEVAAVAVNALDAKMYGEKDYSIGVEKGTLLNQMFRLRYVDGVFYSGKAAGLNGKRAVVDNVVYKTAFDEYYDDLNGCMVRAYINVDNDMLECIDRSKYKNNFYTVDSTDIISVKNSSLFFYDKDGKEKSISLKGITEVYNGVVVKCSPNDFAVSNGSIVFVSCGGTYEAALINSYDTIVVGAVSDYVVYDYYNNTYNHKFEADEKLEFILDGNEIGIDDLRNGDVLSVAYSKDEKYCKVLVSRTTVSGEVSEMDRNSFKVGRKRIYRSVYFAKNSDDPRLGQYVEIALDYFGRAAAMLDVNTANTEYKYFIDAAQESGLSGKIKLKMYDLDKGIQIYTLADRVEVNGESVNKPSLAFDDSKYTTSGDALSRALRTQVSISGGNTVETVMRQCVSQVIKCRVNSEGYVTLIDTAVHGENEDEETLTLNGQFKNTIYKPAALGFSHSYSIRTGRSFSLYAPNEKLNQFDSGGYLTEDTRSMVEDAHFIEASIVLSNDTEYSGLAYDVTDGGVAMAMIVENPNLGKGKAEVDGELDMFIVKEVRKAVNRVGIDSYKVIGYMNTNYKEYTVADPKSFLKDLNDPDSIPVPGDIVPLQVDMYGEIQNVTLRYDYGGKGKYTYKWNGACLIESGYVYSNDNDGLILVDEDEFERMKKEGADAKPTKYTIVSAQQIKDKVFVFDSENKDCYKADFNSLVNFKYGYDKASFVCFRLVYYVPAALVIYK